MNIDTTDYKKVKQSAYFAMSQSLEPVKIESDTESSSTTTTLAFMSGEAATSVSKLMSSSNSDILLPANISFLHAYTTMDDVDVEPAKVEATNSDTLNISIRHSAYPNLLNVLGSVKEIDDGLLQKLNLDPRLFPNSLKEGPKLFVSFLIYTGHSALFILSCESYARSSELDIRMERSGASVPLPYTKLQRRYDGLTVQIMEQADAGKPVKKFIIGNQGWILLVTASLVIFPSSKEPCQCSAWN